MQTPRAVTVASAAIVLVVFGLTWSPCTALFPRVCAGNATRRDAVCCPPMPNDPYGSICGGHRGSCQRIVTISPSQRFRAPELLRVDDRLDWPQAFFNYTCSCTGNFWGYACHRCKPGWWGENCKIQGIGRTRRNALTMTQEQKDYFRDVLDIAKYMPSDWVTLNITSRLNGDPISKLQPPIPFYDVSVYNLIITMHMYSARSTLLHDVMRKCSPDVHSLDFAHRGVGFLTWHRYYLWEVESMLDDVAKSETQYPEPFALPYWDWVGQTNCSVCTNDLIGALDQLSTEHHLDVISNFHFWTKICAHRAAIDDCHICDPTKPQPLLWRSYSTNPKQQHLSTQADMDYLMSLKNFDVPPYSLLSNSSSFRNNLEGFINVDNTPSFDNNYMHNLAHLYMNGSNHDVAASPNDPLFWLIHSYIDKIYDIWMRKNPVNCTVLPLDAPIGHARFDPIVPFFPRVLLCDAVQLAEKFGVQYDNYLLGTKNYFTDTDCTKKFTSGF